MNTYTAQQKPAMMVVGIHCRTSNAPDRGPRDIGQVWGRFYSENILAQIPSKASNEIIAIYCDYEGDHTQPYTFVLGCAVSSLDNVPEGMVAKTLPKGSYAQFRAIGEHPKTIIETWGEIWQTNLERTYTGDYEVYGDKFFSGSPQEVEVFIAIQNG